MKEGQIVKGGVQSLVVINFSLEERSYTSSLLICRYCIPI